MKNNECKRIISMNGKVETIFVTEHSFRWSGKMPCTGQRVCVFCGKVEGKDENKCDFFQKPLATLV